MLFFGMMPTALTETEGAGTEYTAKVEQLQLEKDYTGKTIILHTNDVHGAIEGYAYIPTLRNWFYDHGATVIYTVDAGDYSQGSIYVSTSKGLTAIQMMNAAGYNLATLGNRK